MYEGRKCSERTSRIANTVAAVVLILGVVFVPHDTAGARAPGISDSPPTSTGNSCLSTFRNPSTGTGWNGSAFNWADGTPVELYMKCYYSTGYNTSPWFTGDTPLGTGDCFQWLHDGASTIVSASYNAASAWRWTNYELLDQADRYVEFKIRLTRMSGVTYNEAGSGSRVTIRVQRGCTGSVYEVLGYHGNTGSYTSADARKVSWDSYVANEPSYRWGPSALEPHCEDLRMFIADPGVPVGRGGSLEVEFTEAWEDLVFAEQAKLRYRWSPADPWVQFFDAATATSSPPAVWTFINSSSGARSGVTFEVECSNWGDTAYIRGDNSAGGSEPQAARACAALTVGWMPEGIYPGSENVGLSLAVGSTGTDEIDELLVGGGRFGAPWSSPTIDEVTPVSSITFLNPVGTPEALPVGEGVYLARFTPDETFNTDDGVFLRCHDGTGYLNFQFKPPSGVGKVVEEGYGDRFEECMQSVDFGWRPSSWVPSLLRTGTCIMQVIFVPSEGDVAVLFEHAEALKSKAPIGYVVELGGLAYELIDDAPAALAAHRNDCMPVPIPQFGGADGDQELCLDQFGGGWTEMRFFASAAMWGAFVWWGWGAVRRNIA